MPAASELARGAGHDANVGSTVPALLLVTDDGATPSASAPAWGRPPRRLLRGMALTLRSSISLPAG